MSETEEMMASKEIQRPEVLYRAYTIDPRVLSVDKLHQDLTPNTSDQERSQKLTDSNEPGVYMSTNQLMVEAAYSHSRIDGLSIETPRFNDRGGFTDRLLLPTVGLVLEIDPEKVDIREPKISETMRGHYNNGFEGKEWITDLLPADAYKVKKMILATGPNDRNKFVVEMKDDLDSQQAAVELIQQEFEKRQQLLQRKARVVEELDEGQRYNEFYVKREFRRLEQEFAQSDTAQE